MGNLLRRVCEGGSVIYGVLAVLGCTFSGGNITLGCPARAPDNISSPPLVCVPWVWLSHPRPLTRPGHPSPGRPALALATRFSLVFTSFRFLVGGRGSVWRPAQISLIVCQNKHCCHPLCVTSVVYDHYLIVFDLRNILFWNLFSPPPSGPCISWMLMYSSSSAGPRGEVISI